MAQIEITLVHFHLAAVTKKLDYVYERSALEPSAEPGTSFTRRMAYGLKEDGETALEVSWIENYGNPTSG